MPDEVPSVGVEEEYQLVDPQTGRLLPNCREVMRTLRTSGADRSIDADIQHEMHLNQIEMASDVCQSLDEVTRAVTETRSLLAAAAAANDCRLAAAGTNPLPLPDHDSITPKTRYRAMSDRFQVIARDLFIFGCHVHVSMPDRELGLGVMNRCRRWLPLLQAVSANSPCYDGEDTGYASYRRELWSQWPMAGPPPHFARMNDYRRCIDALVACGAIRDESFLYWDIRLPKKVPTIEFRVADVMTSVDETVGYVGLVRAMVMRAVAEVRQGVAAVEIMQPVLAYSLWHAARYGMTADLIDPATSQRPVAIDWLRQTVDELSGELAISGDRGPVDRWIELLQTEGTGADRQRRSLGQDDTLQAVVRNVVDATA